MTPKQAYDDISSRAQLLYRLYEGLTDVRRRPIRKDWRRSFCHFMHWNQRDAIGRVDSVAALIVLRQGTQLSTGDFSKDSLADLLRSAHVIGVSALDRYVHERVVKNIVRALRKAELSDSQRDFGIPAAVAVRMATAVARARRARPRRRSQVRPANEVRKAVQELLHKRPLQSWREIQYAFELIGINGFDGKLQAATRTADISTTKRNLAMIVQRRNFIVHEGDLIRHKRGGRVKRRHISPKETRDALDFLDSFVRILERVK